MKKFAIILSVVWLWVVSLPAKAFGAPPAGGMQTLYGTVPENGEIKPLYMLLIKVFLYIILPVVIAIVLIIKIKKKKK